MSDKELGCSNNKIINETLLDDTYRYPYRLEKKCSTTILLLGYQQDFLYMQYL